MIKLILKSGFYYKGEILDETIDKIIIKDITGKTVEISKDDISVKEVEE